MAHDHDVTSPNGIRYRRMLCPNCGRPHLAVTLCNGNVHVLFDIEGNLMRMLTSVPSLGLEHEATLETDDNSPLPLIFAMRHGLRDSLVNLRAQADAQMPVNEQPGMTLH